MTNQKNPIIQNLKDGRNEEIEVKFLILITRDRSSHFVACLGPWGHIKNGIKKNYIFYTLPQMMDRILKLHTNL